MREREGEPFKARTPAQRWMEGLPPSLEMGFVIKMRIIYGCAELEILRDVNFHSHESVLVQ